MQQKTKFIILITLICFISLWFLPAKVFGWEPCDAECESGEWDCEWVDGIKDNCTCSEGGDCEAPTEEGSTEEPDDKWCCTCDGVMDTCYKCSKTGAASTKAKCEECCPCGPRLECRHPLTTFFGADADAYYCKAADVWCEVNPGNECSDGDAKCIDCNKTTWQCYDSSNTQKYTTFSSCEIECVQPTSYSWVECSADGYCNVEKTSDNPPPEGTFTCHSDADCSDTTDTTEPSEEFDFNLSNDGDIIVTKPSSGSVSGSNEIDAHLHNRTTQSVSFSQSGLPSGVSASSISDCAYTLCSMKNKLTIKSSASAGTYSIKVTGTGGGLTRTTKYNLIIKESTTDTTEPPTTDTTEPPTTKYTCDTSTWTCSKSADGVYATKSVCEENCIEPSSGFDFSVYTYSQVKVTRPSSGSVEAKNLVGAILISGDKQLVSFTQSGFPNGVSAPNPKSCKPTCYYNNYLTIKSSTPLGTFTITITGTGKEGLKRTKTYKLKIKEPDSTTTTTKSSSTTSSTTTTTTPPPPAPLPCSIDYFELPNRAWVGYPITGRWSASVDCDDCDVDCVPYPACVWKLDNIGIGWDEYKFTLSQSGTYNYTLTCYGPGGADERQETSTVEAINLPWWREIIPVLRGFLGGVWR